MLRFVFVVLLFALAYAKPGVGIDPFVVGGTPAKEGQFPFVVSLRRLSGPSFCGGALISNRYVLTAAHCVSEIPEMRIGAGSVSLNAQKLYDIDKIIVHPSYNSDRVINDIALVRLKTSIDIIDKVKTINFPITENLTGKNATGLGWGRTSTNGPASNVLMYLNRKIIDNSECNKKHIKQILDSQVCLGCEENFGMCFGDSGSPLLYKGTDGKDYVAGIVSWGVPCARGFPDVFTRVSSFDSWIKQNMV